MKNKKQPILRFSDYSDEWKTHVLRDVVERVTRKNKGLESQLPLTISAQYGLVNQISYFNKQVASKDMSNYFLLKRGEFAYNKSYSRDYPWGAIKRLDKYDMGALSSLYITFKPYQIDSNFLVSYYDTTKWHKEVSTRATEGARNHGLLNISANDFLDTEIFIPSQKEQEKIGSFFKQIDEAIALQQQELDILKQTKQGFLQKMFPREGESVPEIRFSNFEGEWKRYAWKDTVDISTNMVDPKSGEYDHLLHVGPGNIESFTGRILNNVKSVKEDNLISGKFHFKAGDVIYGKINPQLGKCALPNFEGLASADSYVLNTKEDLTQEFLFRLLQGQSFYKYSVSVSRRTGMPKINRDELNQYEFLIPSTLEQKKISNFFNKLDKSIELHEKELEALKETKKAFLQKMFV